MNLPDLKELKKLVIGLRKIGVKSIKTDEIELVLTDSPVEPTKRRPRGSKIKSHETPLTQAEIDEDQLSEEDLLYYSVGAGEVDFTRNMS